MAALLFRRVVLHELPPHAHLDIIVWLVKGGHDQRSGSSLVELVEKRVCFPAREVRLTIISSLLSLVRVGAAKAPMGLSSSHSVFN